MTKSITADLYAIDPASITMGVCYSKVEVDLLDSNPRIKVWPMHAEKLHAPKSRDLHDRLPILMKQLSSFVADTFVPGNARLFFVETPRPFHLPGRSAAGALYVYASIGAIISRVALYENSFFYPIAPEEWTMRTGKDMHIAMAMSALNDYPNVMKRLLKNDNLWTQHNGQKAKTLDDNVADAICIAGYFSTYFYKGGGRSWIS